MQILKHVHRQNRPGISQRLEAEQRENDRVEAEQRERERLVAERRESERLGAEWLEKNRLEAERRRRLEPEQCKREEKERLQAEQPQREGTSNGKTVPPSPTLTRERVPAQAEIPPIIQRQGSAMRKQFALRAPVVVVLLLVVGVIWFARSKLDYRRQEEAPVTSTPTSTPTATGSSVALRNYWKPNEVVDADHAMAFRAWLNDNNEKGVEIATFIDSSEYAAERSKAVAALIRPNQP